MRQLFLVVAVCASWAAPAHAGSLAPTRASQLVTLSTYNATSCGGAGSQLVDRVEGSDGSNSTFSIPAGQVFVVTDVEMNVRTVAGTPVRATIQRYQGATGKSFFIDNQYLTADANGFARFTMSFSQGRVVESGLGLCAYAVETNSFTFVVSNAVVHGFFARDS
jgi:hypothetical protein